MAEGYGLANTVLFPAADGPRTGVRCVCRRPADGLSRIVG